MSEHYIKFSKVNISVGDHPVLEHISFHWKKGKNYLLTGPAGAGKTTFLKAIAGKVFPRQGKISKKGIIEFVPGDYKFHRYVGPVYQYYQQRYHAYDSEIGPTLYEVLQNQVKPLGTIDERSVELDDPLYEDSHLKKVADLFKIDHLLHRKITSLSTGETRRSLLARSVLKEPDFLLLDNPFVGLDKESRILLRNVLASLQDISFMVICDPSDVRGLKLQDLFMQDGRKVSELSNIETSNNQNIDLPIDLGKGEHEEFEIAVRFQDAIVTYGSFYALKNFSWTVRKSEKWALMGPNGSGKSTVISLITADNPQAYRNNIILFDKKRGTGESIWDIKKKIGYVSPELQLYCEKEMSVWKIVASGLFDTAGLYKTLTDKELQIVFSYIRMIGIEDIAERRFDQLSTGEQRLTFLARALVKNPPMLILDEPCQGLDYGQMVRFRELLNTIVVHFDQTLIYVTHYEEELPDCINQRIDISNGELLKISKY